MLNISYRLCQKLAFREFLVVQQLGLGVLTARARVQPWLGN